MRASISRRGIIAGAVGTIAAAVLVFSPIATSAHEHRTVGDYEVVVGFLNEPAVSGELNGLDFRVSQPSATPATPTADGTEAASTPVEGLETTLQAEVIYGDQKMPLTLEGVYKTPGSYAAYFIPTAAGDYSFHIWGTINGTDFDETFTAGPDTFSTVIDRTTLEFPAAS
ncbi:MAG: hypothetical protein ACRDHN_00450 [Thermomicrobiales bacterium]